MTNPSRPTPAAGDPSAFLARLSAMEQDIAALKANQPGYGNVSGGGGGNRLRVPRYMRDLYDADLFDIKDGQVPVWTKAAGVGKFRPGSGGSLPALSLVSSTISIAAGAPTALTWTAPDGTETFNLGGAFTWTAGNPTRVFASVNCIVAVTAYLTWNSIDTATDFLIRLEGLTRAANLEEWRPLTTNTSNPVTSVTAIGAARFDAGNPGIRVSASHNGAGSQGVRDGFLTLVRVRTL